MKLALIAVSSLLALTACEEFKNFGATSSSGGKSAKSSSSGSAGEIKIVTIPSGAGCAIDKNNMTIERARSTPATVKVSGGGEFKVRCLKSGYKEGSAVVSSNWNGTYDSVTITLKKK